MAISVKLFVPLCRNTLWRALFTGHNVPYDKILESGRILKAFCLLLPVKTTTCGILLVNSFFILARLGRSNPSRLVRASNCTVKFQNRTFHPVLLTVCMATALKKVQPRIAFGSLGATCKRNPLTNPAFVSFGKSGSSAEMHGSTMMDECKDFHHLPGTAAGQPLKSAEPSILVIMQPTSRKAVAIRRHILTPRRGLRPRSTGSGLATSLHPT